MLAVVCCEAEIASSGRTTVFATHTSTVRYCKTLRLLGAVSVLKYYLAESQGKVT